MWNNQTGLSYEAYEALGMSDFSWNETNTSESETRSAYSTYTFLLYTLIHMPLLTGLLKPITVLPSWTHISYMRIHFRTRQFKLPLHY